MNRLLSSSAAFLVLLFGIPALPARAQDQPPAEHHSVGIGFHNANAPIGVRWWLSNQKLAIDLGFGFHSEPSELFTDEHLKGWAIDAGVPIVLKSWTRFHALLRPGLYYEHQETDVPGPTFAPAKDKLFIVSGQIEAEAFLVDNFSVSAATGIAWQKSDPEFGDSETSFITEGGNFTTVGFHAYLFR